MAAVLFEQGICGDLGFSFETSKTHRRHRIAELGPLVIVGEPFADKVSLFLSEPISQSSTDQERFSQ